MFLVQTEECKKMLYRAVPFARGRPRRKRMICKNSLSYLNVLFAIHNIHVNEQLSKAENSMLRLDKERLVKEVNATKVLFKIFTSS